LAGVIGTVSAAILFAIACPPYQLAWVAWAVPGLLLVSTRKFSPRAAFMAGVAFALLIGVSVGNWLPGAAGAGLGLSEHSARPLVYAYLLLNPGVPCGLLLAAYAYASRRIATADLPICGAFLWIASEWLRSYSLGWTLLGHTQFRETWLIQVADIGGVYAVSFVLALVSIALAEIIANRAWRRLSAAGLAGRMVLPAGAVLVAAMYGIVSQGVHGPLHGEETAQTEIEQQSWLPAAYEPAGDYRVTRTGLGSPAPVEQPQLRLRQVSVVRRVGNQAMNVSPLLCLDILDTGLMRRLVREGAEILINNCRVPWMETAGTAAPAQHLAMTVFRAVEMRRFVIRAGTSGESQMVSPFGTLYDGPPEAGTQLRLRGDLSRYVSMGDGWILIGLCFSGLTVLRGRKNA
jgi:apolipoprotein N-acyltransferase